MQVFNIWLFVPISSMVADWKGRIYLPLFSKRSICSINDRVLHETYCGDKAKMEKRNVCLCCICSGVVYYVLSSAYRYPSQGGLCGKVLAVV